MKRHQKVAGCEAAPEVEADVAAAPAEVAPVEEEAVARAEITAQQVAAWQRQRGFVAPEPPKQPLIDWDAARATAEEFVDFLHDSKVQAVGAGRGLLVLASRLSLFTLVVAAVGWFLLSGNLLASPAAAAGQNHPELAARTVVENFLQTAQLKQYNRALDYLAPQVRQSVDAGQLETMFGGLPLSQAPESWKSELTAAGTAEVVIKRAGAQEVYTLVQDDRGWGLCSVSVSRG